MDYSEKDIEEFIYENELLENKGFRCLQRQFQTAYGIIDILAYSSEHNRLVVVELKKGVVDEGAVGQVLRYMSAIKELFEGISACEDSLDELKGIKPYPLGLLIGSDQTEGVKAIIRNYTFLKFMETTAFMDVSLREVSYSRIKESLEKEVKTFINSPLAEELACLIVPVDYNSED